MIMNLQPLIQNNQNLMNNNQRPGIHLTIRTHRLSVPLSESCLYLRHLLLHPVELITGHPAALQRVSAVAPSAILDLLIPGQDVRLGNQSSTPPGILRHGLQT